MGNIYGHELNHEFPKVFLLFTVYVHWEVLVYCKILTQGPLRVHPPRKPTSEEIEKQRISFIFANLSKDSTVTRDQIEEDLREERGGLASEKALLVLRDDSV